MYVDDATVFIRGRTGTVVDIAVDAAEGRAKAFEQAAGLPVSKTKGRSASSSITVANGIQRKPRAFGVIATRVMSVLGIDTVAGRGGLHRGMKARFSVMV